MIVYNYYIFISLLCCNVLYMIFAFCLREKQPNKKITFNNNKWMAVVNYCQEKLHFKFAQFFCATLSTILTIIENKPTKMTIGNLTRANQKIVL